MKIHQISRIGAILFFIGIIFLLLSWNFTYPVHMAEVDELTFKQFYPLIWPGIIISLIGLFLTGYYSEKKSVKAICASLFPIILYVDRYYFSYIPSPDCGAVKAMFEVFHNVKIDSSVVPYFQYPTFFSLNEITSQILGVAVNNIAIIFFALYGILLGSYLFLFIFKNTKNNRFQIAFLAIPVFFTVTFGGVSSLNYQWVPQTLALVFFLLLLIIFNREQLKYKILSMIVFCALVFTHAFIPVIFLIIFAIYIFKKRELISFFILMCCVYLSILIFYNTYYFPLIIDAFKEVIGNFGEEYSSNILGSIREPSNFWEQIISLVNRIRIPFTLLLISFGFLMITIKKKINFIFLILTITAGFYLAIGAIYSVLGLRGLQILFISLVVGIGFYIPKWKKQIVTIVIILLILSVFGLMRSAYDQTQFLSPEEELSCNFLAKSLPAERLEIDAIDQVNWGYFTTKYTYSNGFLPNAIRPSHSTFYKDQDDPEKNEYIIYNPNLAKEMITYGVQIGEIYNIISEKILGDKIYMCGKTYVVKDYEASTINYKNI